MKAIIQKDEVIVFILALVLDKMKLERTLDDFMNSDEIDYSEYIDYLQNEDNLDQFMEYWMSLNQDKLSNQKSKRIFKNVVSELGDELFEEKCKESIFSWSHYKGLLEKVA
ncbi:MAG: hypothetical protein RJQ09_03695 [Cyclobacteriaceae bacterium]